MSQSSDATHYDVLDVSRSADQAAIRKAYLRASLRYHPDKNPGREEEAKAEFIKVGRAYEVLGDSAKRAAYDREIASGWGRFRPKSQQQQQQQQQQQKPYGYEGSTQHQQTAGNASSKQESTETTSSSQTYQDDEAFDKFADMFDETVGGMSEEELNAAMGAASIVGGILGSILASHATKSNNSFLQTAASMAGSAMASKAASELVKTVHEDSAQRCLEKRERQAAIARGEKVPQPGGTSEGKRRFQDAGKAFQKAAGAAVGGGGSSQSDNANQKSNNRSSYFTSNRSTTNNSATTSNNNNGGGDDKSQFDWAQAAKIAGMAIGACMEMQSGSKEKQSKR